MTSELQAVPSDAPPKDGNSAKRRLVVHLGFPKTGTTTIQRMLSENADALAPRFEVSAKDDLTYRLRKYALRFMRTGFTYWRWRHDVAMRTMVRQVDSMNFETLVISDENMVGIESGELFARNGGREYPRWLAKLDNALSRYEVIYVLYTRAPEAWQVSSYNQAFKMRRVTEPFDRWRARHDDLCGPDKIIAGAREVLGDRLVVFKMEDEVAEGKLLGHNLLKVAGVQEDYLAALRAPARENESLPAAAIELLQKVHKTPGIRRRQYRELVRLFARNPELFASNKR